MRNECGRAELAASVETFQRREHSIVRVRDRFDRVERKLATRSVAGDGRGFHVNDLG